MTSLLEKIVAKIAPHHCISCGIEDNILCDGCLESVVTTLPPSCCLCGKPSSDWRTCPLCSASSGLSYIWAGGPYEGLLAKTLHMHKFARAKAAHVPLAGVMLRELPHSNWRIVYVPTVATRVRQRGYDQAYLLAKHIAVERDLPLLRALSRLQDSRQVGATRVQRAQQSIKMFSMAPNVNVRGANILLVDDVCTTGATLSAAARLLREAGAANVSAVVAAWKR